MYRPHSFALCVRIFAASAVFALGAASAQAATISFILDGNAGLGLLGGNENAPVANGGSGGLQNAGISLDTGTNILSIDVGWGSGNGFSDLTGNATAGHIHGETASAAPAGFSQNAGVLVGISSLTGWNASASAGGFTGSVSLTAGQAASILAGKTYINIHTATNGGGEIRGHLVPVPEPTTALLFGLGLGALALRRR